MLEGSPGSHETSNLIPIFVLLRQKLAITLLVTRFLAMMTHDCLHLPIFLENRRFDRNIFIPLLHLLDDLVFHKRNFIRAILQGCG